MSLLPVDIDKIRTCPLVPGESESYGQKQENTTS